MGLDLSLVTDLEAWVDQQFYYPDNCFAHTAPITPPEWVMVCVQAGEYVYWDQKKESTDDRTLRLGLNVLHFLTYADVDKQVVTHLMPGSLMPPEGWLNAL